MDLNELLKRRGYRFRQHLDEAGWAALEAEGKWCFPALEITQPLPRHREVVLSEGGVPRAVVVAPSTGTPRDLANRFLKEMDERFGLTLEVVEGETADQSVLATGDVVLFGGSHENACAMKMALRYHTLFVDAAVPGEGGWVVSTLTGLDPSGTNAVQISASADTAEPALDALLGSVHEVDGRVVSGFVHEVHPGPLMQEHWTGWDDFSKGLPSKIAQLKGREYDIPTDVRGLSELLVVGLDSGGPDVNHYNVGPLHMSIRCAQYYLRSGDRRALELFRELLFRTVDYYLLTPEGASIPSDFDFRLGHMVLYFTRLEHDPIFTDEDRLILANFLLACTRSIHEYALAFWPVEWNGRTRHNHETFPGRSLLYAADTFERYGLDERVAEFRDHAARIFSGGMWERYKQRENACHYEIAAFEHGINASTFLGKGFDLFKPGVLKTAASRSLVVADNFFRTVDYGDTNITTSPAGADALTTLVSCGQPDPVLDWFGEQVFKGAPWHMPDAANGGIPAIRRGYSGGHPASSGDWEFLPLDPQFMEDFAGDFPPAYAFDKMAFRTGWEDDDHYLLLEGVGNKDISHAHLELNGIVRLNHLGRHWLVSNGYGKHVDVSNASKAFSSRVLGPEDHNMLVLKRDGEVVVDFPVCAAMLQRGRQRELLYSTGAVLDIGGVDWYRTLVVLAGRSTACRWARRQRVKDMSNGRAWARPYTAVGDVG